MTGHAGHGALTITRLRHDRAELPAVEVVAFVHGKEVGARKIELAPVVVGASRECDLEVPAEGVSRRHCAIALTETGVVVRDLGSKNGTTIGGVSIVEAYLPLRATIAIGSAVLSLRITGKPIEVPLWTAGRFGSALGGSTVMRALFAYLDRAARTECSILLLGESGTGKDLLARAIHEASSRRDGPFVVFDAGSVTDGLVAAELFGQVKGAFTGATSDRHGVFARANGGTLFLDEIGELPVALQPLLLRAVEERRVQPVGASVWRPVDVRIVAATNRDLRADIDEKTFRADLYHRLAVVTARVPPLRERKDDLDLLVEGFLASRSPPRSILDLPKNALELLRAYDWPGNVRELRNAVERMVVFPEDAHVLGTALGAGRSPPNGFEDVFALTWKDAREEVMHRLEAAYVADKLQETAGNVSRAAAAMEVSRQFLHRLIERHGLKVGR